MRERTQLSLLGGVGLLYYWPLLRHVQEDNINLWKKLSKSYSWFFFLPCTSFSYNAVHVSFWSYTEANCIYFIAFIYSNCIWINKCINGTELLKSTQIVQQFSVASEKYPAASCRILATEYLSACSKWKISL